VPPDAQSNTTATAAILLANSNSTFALAPAGHYGPCGVTPTPCPINTYKPSLGGSGTVVDCLPCPTNTNSTTGGTACVPGAGYYGPAVSPCPINTYKPTTGGNGSLADCIACPINTNTNGTTAATSCFGVAAGFYGFLNGTPTRCPVNTYKPIIGGSGAVTDCLACPFNTNTNGLIGVANVVGCIANAGFFGPDGTAPTVCPEGTFKTRVGATAGTVSDCTALAVCPADQHLLLSNGQMTKLTNWVVPSQVVFGVVLSGSPLASVTSAAFEKGNHTVCASFVCVCVRRAKVNN
jgi:hypothetical protein